MFGMKNKAVQVKLVDTKKDDTTVPCTPVKTVDYAEIAMIATEFSVKTIGAIGAVIAANKVLTAACDIAVIAAKAKIK
jgi:hypothetical protein